MIGDSRAPLVFVFLGEGLPSYAYEALNFAATHSGRRTYLLVNFQCPEVPRGVMCEDVRSWYSPRQFQDFKSQSPLNPGFRQGFWLLAAERFFVLSQWAVVHGIESLFHAELDNLVFNLDHCEEDLQAFAQSVFFPCDSSGRGFGSLMYFKSRVGLEELVDFMVCNAEIGNEMALLGAFLAARPSVCYRLPSVESVCAPGAGSLDSKPPAIRGLADAAALGQWLFGIDPANTSKSVRNRWQNEKCDVDLSALKFCLNPITMVARIARRDVESLPVWNLHVHSKIVKRLNNPLRLWFYVWISRFPIRIAILARGSRNYKDLSSRFRS